MLTIKNIIFIGSIILFAISCKKDTNLEPKKIFLKNRVGKYEGISHFWIGYPGEVNGVYQYVQSNRDYKVKVIADLGSQDSCLNLTIYHNDTLEKEMKNVKFISKEAHYSRWGGGSSFGDVFIYFSNDTLHYYLYQKCGNPCTTKESFSIIKN